MIILNPRKPFIVGGIITYTEIVSISMGIEGGKKLLPKPNRLDINELTKGNKIKIYKVVIDVASIVHRYTIGSINSGTEICDKDRNKIPEIYYLVIIAIRLLSLGILPIFVFDGSAPDIKADTIKQRRKCKDDAEENLERIKNTNKGIYLTPRMFQ